MDEITITIPLRPPMPGMPKSGYRLPGLNDYIHAINKNRHIGNRLKRNTQDYIIFSIPPKFRGLKLSPVAIEVEFFEYDRRRDRDNITSAKKFIFDALQEAGVIAGDGQRHVVSVHDDVFIDKERPRVVVKIQEV